MHSENPPRRQGRYSDELSRLSLARRLGIQTDAVGWGCVAPVIEDEPDADIENDHVPLRVDGIGFVRKPKHHSFIAPSSVLAPADLDSLVAAIRWEGRCCRSMPEQVFFADVPAQGFEPLFCEPENAYIEVGEDSVQAVVKHDLLGERLPASEYLRLLGGVAARSGCQVSSVVLEDEYGTPLDAQLAEFRGWFESGMLSAAEIDGFVARLESRPCVAKVRIVPGGPMTAGRLMSATTDVLAFLGALKSGALDARGALDLLRAGRFELFIGMPEGPWFEVKGQAYNLPAPANPSLRAKIELAQDVARFANGDRDALLVVGMATIKQDGVEKVASITPAKVSESDAQRYREVIDSHLVPALEGCRSRSSNAHRAEHSWPFSYLSNHWSTGRFWCMAPSSAIRR
jgi:hypothetical protein